MGLDLDSITERLETKKVRIDYIIMNIGQIGNWERFLGTNWFLRKEFSLVEAGGWEGLIRKGFSQKVFIKLGLRTKKAVFKFTRIVIYPGLEVIAGFRHWQDN